MERALRVDRQLVFDALPEASAIRQADERFGRGRIPLHSDSTVARRPSAARDVGRIPRAKSGGQVCYTPRVRVHGGCVLSLAHQRAGTPPRTRGLNHRFIDSMNSIH